ncbi:hypothetical protein [Halonotius roseus]|uniref:Uncharacterized protein n=1 Tax=Halonotius roseus TaxID=2511997 RepID=A0A544QR49_9EURY|nr:hypothetical protein [Halonotius roseus]TQQ81912.1 hypothetical protein EWF95_02945 [Halonotius roseus]
MTDGTTSGTAIDPHEERILETAAARPELTAAEIAEQTGHIVPTVRDTLTAHGDSIDAEEGQPTTGSKPIDSASFNATERAVLEAALREPQSTNREIAARVDTHVGLVRDIRETYEAVATLPDDESAGATADESAMEFDQELLSSAQEEILELVRADPSLTNAEIAERTGNRLPLVRDTIAAHGPEAPTRRRSGGPKPTDSASFNATEQAVLEAALRSPEATNKEIAARVDTHVGLVRDIRETYEEAATLPDGHDGERAATTADSDDADRDELSETQHAILEVAADSAERTYADIAEQTGARLPLVRDTLETYDPDDVIAGATSETAESTAELSESQQRIIEHAAANPTQTYAEIAAATDSRLPLVRDTLEAHGDTSA